MPGSRRPPIEIEHTFLESRFAMSARSASKLVARQRRHPEMADQPQVDDHPEAPDWLPDLLDDETD